MITQTYIWTWPLINCTDAMIAAQSPPIDLTGKSGDGDLLMCYDNCSTSGGYVGHEVPITGYCTDFSAALDVTNSLLVGIGSYWHLVALRSIGWSLSSLIDLNIRPDNGLINTAPVATCISYISIPVNVQQTIQIPVLDADNDIVRCRFASGTSECANACPPTSLPTGTTLSSSCMLTITGPTAGNYYLVAAQAEDFITNASTNPMSSVPIQFLVYVYAATNCTIKPLLLSDMASGDCLGAEVGVSVVMHFTAVNLCGSDREIIDIATLSFPTIIKSAVVQSPTNASIWSMEMTWIPSAMQVGSQVLCAVACDNASVQSDQYCITIFVGLSSVPLCPGATAGPTTTTTTTIETTTNILSESSIKQMHDSTVDITTMEMSTSIDVQTSRVGAFSKRRKNVRELEGIPIWAQQRRKSHEKLQREENQKQTSRLQHSRSANADCESRISSTITLTRDLFTTMSDYTLPSDNVLSPISDEMSNEDCTKVSDILQDYDSPESTSLFGSPTPEMDPARVVRVPRMSKPSVVLNTQRFTMSIELEVTNISNNDLNDGEIQKFDRCSQLRVPVTRIKRL
ncbi:unnamed protein product [Rotaria socialis]|uniref:Uncharacterized protein n=2 Tax=Rotaria socialis TaxID=392032 RepID=A0A820VPT4_9BILA|nr:unnamed protein product [Rotaria socialis]